MNILKLGTIQDINAKLGIFFYFPTKKRDKK